MKQHDLTPTRIAPNIVRRYCIVEVCENTRIFLFPQARRQAKFGDATYVQLLRPYLRKTASYGPGKKTKMAMAAPGTTGTAQLPTEPYGQRSMEKSRTGWYLTTCAETLHALTPPILSQPLNLSTLSFEGTTPRTVAQPAMQKKPAAITGMSSQQLTPISIVELRKYLDTAGFAERKEPAGTEEKSAKR